MTAETDSLWMQHPLPRSPALDRDLEVDVVVVGAGVTVLRPPICCARLARESLCWNAESAWNVIADIPPHI